MKLYPYHGINGRIKVPQNVVNDARERAQHLGAQVVVAPIEGNGNYTIPPLEGWAITARARDGKRYVYHYDRYGNPCGSWVYDN